MKPVIGLTCSTSTETSGSGVRRFHCPEPYVRRVEEAGGLPILLPTTDPARVEGLLGLVDGVILIGGDDVDPALYGAKRSPHLGSVDRPRDDFELEIARVCAAGDLPAFGICRGHQVMNVALGGTLIQHIPAEVAAPVAHSGRTDETHPASVVAGSRLHALLGARRLAVNSHHHQAVSRLAKALRVTATAPDGVIEAAELPGHAFFLAVQWHPERMPKATATKRLFRAFVAAAAARRGAGAGTRSRRVASNGGRTGSSRIRG
jgi:putative glutamine amidotransferase